jgi:hypothetical protein
MLGLTRTVLTAMPDRDRLEPDTQSGSIGGHSWRLDVTPFLMNDVDLQGRWAPVSVIVTIQTKNSTKRFYTVRLRRKPDRS